MISNLYKIEAKQYEKNLYSQKPELAPGHLSSAFKTVSLDKLVARPKAALVEALKVFEKSTVVAPPKRHLQLVKRA